MIVQRGCSALRTIQRTVIGCFMLASLACSQESAIWLAPNATADHLVFLVGHRRGDTGGSEAVTTLDVTTCADTDRTHSDHFWGIYRGSNDIPLHVVQYGIAPRGFNQNHTALPLIPGCYRARVSGTGRVRFMVSRNGQVTEL